MTTRAADLLSADLLAELGDLDTFGVQEAGETTLTIYGPGGREVVQPWEVELYQTVKILYIYKIGDRKTLMFTPE
jgi:hypothetical protein